MISQSNTIIASTALGVAYIGYWMWKQIQKYDRSYLKDKVVVITGASSGVGEACAKLFYNAGSKVILCARRKNELERVKTLLMNNKMRKDSSQHEPHVVVVDLEDFDSIEQRAQDIISIHHRVDILVNNAGISNRGDVQSTSLDVFIKVMNVNFIGQVAITKALLPQMISQGSGHIIAVSSLQGKIALPYRAPYSASKHALQAFCDSLRAEVSHHNIDVTVLSPGYITTKLSINALKPDGTKYGITDSATQLGMSPHHAARCIVEATCNKTKELILAPFVYKLVIYLRNIVPNLFFLAMKNRANK
ncbi:hypothetical protein LSH36_97g03008 [Paralvinella palmiformis]|uniref:Ketoreductase domain-containing protein n=1 Tax=Paralvinella palmiformis TaxID=53620 RepID=A0AAD9N9X8_9ANNE|nr:hypothetical protein LSH36_97g03008 [Paralvinella palmiformis]